MEQKQLKDDAIRIQATIGVAALLASSPLSAAAKGNPSYVSLGLESPILELLVLEQGSETSKNKADKELDYSPKSPTIVNLSLSYMGLSGGVSKDLPTGNSNEKLDYTNYQLSYFMDSWGAEAQYTEFLRFRLTSGTGTNIAALSQDEISRLDMAIRDTDANLYWLPIRFNWALDPALDPARPDKTNGLGLGVIATYSAMGIATQFGLVPPSLQKDFGQEGDIKSGQLQSYELQGAIGGTLTSHGLYATALVSAGGGPQEADYFTNNAKVHATGSGQTVIAHLVAGYVGDRWFSNFEFRSDSASYTLKALTLTTRRTDMIGQIGLRF